MSMPAMTAVILNAINISKTVNAESRIERWGDLIS